MIERSSKPDWFDGEPISTFDVACDSCPESFSRESSSLIELVAGLKKEGWIVKHGKKGWEQYCPICAEKEREG